LGAGVTAGYLSTLSFTQIFDEILFTKGPTYTVPTFLISNDVSPYIEIGSSVTVTSNLIGDKNDAGAFTSMSLVRYNDSTGLTAGVGTSSGFLVTSIPNIPNQFGQVNPNNPNYRYTAQILDNYSIPDPFSGYITNVFYSATGSYDSGQKKYDNRGELDTRPLGIRDPEAGQSGDSDFISNIIGASGLYPYFWGYATGPVTTNISNMIAGWIQNPASRPSGVLVNKVVEPSDGSLLIPFVYGATQFPFFATPEAANTKIFVRDLYNSNPVDEIDGNIPVSGGPPFCVPQTLTIDSPDSYWTGVRYKIYAPGRFSSTAGGNSPYRNGMLLISEYVTRINVT
jgi:hypothetical protein